MQYPDPNMASASESLETPVSPEPTRKRAVFSSPLSTVIGTSIVTAMLTSAVMAFAFGAIRKPALLNTAPSPFAVASPASSHEAAVEAAVQRVSPAVVSVVATKDLPVIEQYFVNPFGDNSPFGQLPFQFGIPQQRQNGTQPQQVAAGTGFIVSSDGLILTNRHVVDVPGAAFTVIFSDGSKVDAKVLATDPVQDLAVLKVDKGNLPTVTLGNSDQVQIGETAIAIGNSLGEFQNTVSVGVVSGLARKITAGDAGGGGSETIEGAIQTDAAINPGNSGGPLLNLHGEVIGVNTAIVQGSQNVGFAVPINKAKKAIDDVQKSGKISYAYLGVQYVAITPDIKAARKLSVDSGALVIGSSDGKQPGVVPGSPAAQAGIREGDVIVSVDGKKVDDQHSLTSLIAQRAVGDKITLHIFSNTQERDVQVTLAERPVQ